MIGMLQGAEFGQVFSRSILRGGSAGQQVKPFNPGPAPFNPHLMVHRHALRLIKSADGEFDGWPAVFQHIERRSALGAKAALNDG